MFRTEVDLGQNVKNTRQKHHIRVAILIKRVYSIIPMVWWSYNSVWVLRIGFGGATRIFADISSKVVPYFEQNRWFYWLPLWNPHKPWRKVIHFGIFYLRTQKIVLHNFLCGMTAWCYLMSANAPDILNRHGKFLKLIILKIFKSPELRFENFRKYQFWKFSVTIQDIWCNCGHEGTSGGHPTQKIMQNDFLSPEIKNSKVLHFLDSFSMRSGI